jgi:MutS domain V
MKVRLLYRDRDFDPALAPLPGSDTLTQDLGLDVLFRAMAGSDRFLADVVRRVVLASLDDPAEISYRQDILDDCLAHPEVVRELYQITVQAIDRQRSVWGWSTRFADTLVQRSVEILTLLLESMRRIRAIAEASGPAMRSPGLQRLFTELEAELDDAFLEQVDVHLRRLHRRDEVVLTAALGPGTRGGDYVLRRRVRPRGWRERIGLGEPESYTYQIAPRDDAGAQMLGDIRKRGLALAADATARSSDHVVSFFSQLRSELAFYVGCLNLRDELQRLGAVTSRPLALPATDRSLAASGLYDISLSVAQQGAAVANDVESPEVRLVVVTGANRGGKSTFLRSLGLAQVMMQSGMFVGAAAFTAPVRQGVFTHFRREEDASLRSGKLDEELGRMRWIVDHANARSLVLLNESFASTNEREGSEIGRQVITALLDAGVTVALVTHLYELAHGFFADARKDARFLRAERRPDGRRTFRVVDGEPLPTSHGQDLYQRIFGDRAGDAAMAPLTRPAR